MPPRVTLFPVVDELIGIDDVWLLLGDERRFDIIGDWDRFDIERVGITLRLATTGTCDIGNSETDDVELVIDDVCCERAGIDGWTTLVLGWLPFLAGVGIIVGRRIPPVVDTDDFSELGGGGDGSFVGRDAWETVDGTWRGLDWGLEVISVTYPSDDETSKYSK